MAQSRLQTRLDEVPGEGRFSDSCLAVGCLVEMVGLYYIILVSCSLIVIVLECQSIRHVLKICRFRIKPHDPQVRHVART